MKQLSIKKENLLFSNKYLRALIIPLLIEQLLAITIGMVDTIMIASVGETAVSGVALVDSLSNLFIFLFSAFATGGAVVASQYLGKKDKESASSSAKQLVHLAFFASLFISAIGLIGNKSILSAIFGSVEEEVMMHASTYFIYIAISYPFLAITNGCNAICRSIGKSKITMLVAILMNLINISGNAIFIYVFEMGAAGAGLASLLSRIVGALIMFIIVCNKKLELHLTKPFKVAFTWKMVKTILRIALPSGIENSLFHVGKIIVQSLVASFGTASIAANAIVNTIGGFSNLPGVAIGIGSITILGQCYGAGEKEQVKYYAKKLLKQAYFWMAILCAIFFFLVPTITSWYNLSAEATRISIECNKFLVITTALFWPIAFVIPNFLRACGDVKYTMVTSILSMWIFRVVCAYILGRYLGLGLLGALMGMVIDWLFRGASFIHRFLSERWAKAKVVE